MLNELSDRLAKLFPKLDTAMRAQLCLLVYRQMADEVAKIDDTKLLQVGKKLRLQLEHTTDQYGAVTLELQEMAASNPSKFEQEQVWTLLRAIKIQDQLLKLHIGGEPLNV